MGITLITLEKAGWKASKLAKALGISRQAVEQWKAVPPERVLAVERITGFSRYEQRPDIYGPAPEGSKRRASVAA